MGRFVTGTSSENDAEREVPRYSFVSKEGSYQLELDGDMLIHSSDQRDVLNHFAWHVNSHAMQAATDRLVIHSGAAVSPRGGAVLLPGPSGSGKTGLVAGLVRAGFGYLSDEAAGIDPETGLVLPYPKPLSIKPGMFDRFGAEMDASRAWPISAHQWLVDPDSLRDDSVAGPSTAAFVVFPTHSPGAKTRVTPLGAAESVIALHENVANRSVFGRRALPLLADLAKRAVSYRLESSDPDEAVRVVGELTAG